MAKSSRQAASSPAGALALATVTFNPTSWSYLGWLRAERPGDNLPLEALASVVRLIGFVIFPRSTWRALGSVGPRCSAAPCFESCSTTANSIRPAPTS